jgi:hypothetical protein
MLFFHNIPTPVLQLAFLVIDGVPQDMKISNLFHIAAQNAVHEGAWDKREQLNGDSADGSPATTDSGCSGAAPSGQP